MEKRFYKADAEGLAILDAHSDKVDAYADDMVTLGEEVGAPDNRCLYNGDGAFIGFFFGPTAPVGWIKARGHDGYYTPSKRRKEMEPVRKRMAGEWRFGGPKPDIADDMLGMHGFVSWDEDGILYARIMYGMVGDTMIVVTADHPNIPDPKGCTRIKTSEFYALKEAADEVRNG